MNIKLRVENIGDIQLTPDYWDCECEHNYIRKKEELTCFVCETVPDEQPNSRADEVKRLLKLESFPLV